jgi:hypothetical protein
VHALLNIGDHEALLGHPVSGANWEGFVIESLIAAASRQTVPLFYRTGAARERALHRLRRSQAGAAVRGQFGDRAIPGRCAYGGDRSS